MRKFYATSAAAFAALALTISPAHAESPTYSGFGWKITNQYGVYGLSPTQQFTVTFASQEIKDRWASKLTTAISQLNALGVKISVGGIETYNSSATCPAKGHINFSEKFQPLGQPGYSQGIPCYNTADHSAWGGWVFMDSEYGDGTWPLDGYLWVNLPVHEMMHTIGLDHPNTDLDGDGTVESFECPFGTEGARPVMCSPNGGFKTEKYWGRLSDMDRAGVTALLNNARILGIS